MDSRTGGMLGLKGAFGIIHLLDQLTDEETEAQAEGAVCSYSYGWQEPEPGVGCHVSSLSWIHDRMAPGINKESYAAFSHIPSPHKHTCRHTIN